VAVLHILCREALEWGEETLTVLQSCASYSFTWCQTPAKKFAYITEYLIEQVELSVMFSVTENLMPSQIRGDFAWFFSVAPYECWEGTPNRQ
jgi:hypothetical protein